MHQGLVGAGINEAAQKVLSNIKDPGLHQIASALLGAAAAKDAGGNAQAGASTAASGTKNNWFFIPPIVAALGEAIPYAAGAYLVATPEGRKIVDDTGKALVTWSADAGGFIDGYGKYLGNKWDDVTTWYNKTFNPPATDTSVTNVPTVLNNPANNPTIGGTTTEGAAPASSSTNLPLGDTNGGTSTTIPQTQQNNDPVITADSGSGKAQWYKPDGSINFPPNGGAIPGTEVTKTLDVGQTLGRYGNVGKDSDYVTPPGSTPGSLSLPPYTDTTKYTEYEVVKPIPEVTQSTVAPWGGDQGLGTQFKLPMPIKELIEKGYIREKK